MRIAVISIACVVLSSAVAAEKQGETTKSNDASLGEVVIADELRTAFYEHAPFTLSAAMSKAVRTWCSGTDRKRIADSSESNAETVVWLCANQKLHYFRSVYINGDRGPHGLVCNHPGYKYSGIDMVTEMIGDGECVSAESDGTAYQLYFNDANDSSDASQCKPAN